MKLAERLKSIVGPKGWVEDADELGPHVTEWRGVYEGRTPLLLRPCPRAFGFHDNRNSRWTRSTLYFSLSAQPACNVFNSVRVAPGK